MTYEEQYKQETRFDALYPIDDKYGEIYTRSFVNWLKGKLRTAECRVIDVDNLYLRLSLEIERRENAEKKLKEEKGT